MKKPQKMTRSENMSRIRSTNTKPEILLRKTLWTKGLRYRLYPDLPGRPDLAFSKSRAAVFVDGCFWHGCPLHYSAPRNRWDFWKDKLRRNVLRDMEVDDQLRAMGWKILRIWEHELKHMDEITEKIYAHIRKDTAPPRTYQTEISSEMRVSEAVSAYGKSADEQRLCPCGSADIRVLEVSGPGSLNITSKNRPDSAEFLCRKCRNRFHLRIS